MLLLTPLFSKSCRLPGGRDVKAFSRLLNDGKCAVSWIPPDRWGSARYLHPTPGTSGKAYTFAAGVLDDLFGFDPQPFGISPREAGRAAASSTSVLSWKIT